MADTIGFTVEIRTFIDIIYIIIFKSFKLFLEFSYNKNWMPL